MLFADAERIARADRAAGDAGRPLLVAVRAETPAGAVAWSEVVGARRRLPDVAIDPGRRRLHLLHVRHHRLPEGRTAHPPRAASRT